MMCFGILWVALTAGSFIKFIKAADKTEDDRKDPLTAKFPDEGPVKVGSESPSVSNEFDPVFFNTAKNDYDDEDYKRMKRQGFE